MEAKAIGVKSIIFGVLATVVSFWGIVLLAGPIIIVISSLLAIIIGITGIYEAIQNDSRVGLIYSILGVILGIIPYVVTLFEQTNWLGTLI